MSLRIFLPITKVDAAQRLVYGVFTEEAGDRSGEIMDYASSKPNFEKWSNDMYGASGGKNYGNIRAMHKNIAAGLFAQPIDFQDDVKKMYGCARIVDDDEWRKVEEGVYTGFSVGGRYGKRWADPENPSLIRYEAIPTEVSLVDLPCVKGATFEFFKAEGAAPEARAFTSVGEPEEPPPPLSAPPNTVIKSAASETKTEEETKEATSTEATKTPEQLATEAAEDEGVKKGVKTLNEARIERGLEALPDEQVLKTLASELEQVWKTPDGQTFSKKAEAVKHMSTAATAAAVEAVAGPTEAALTKLDQLLGGTKPEDEPIKAGDPKVTKPLEKNTEQPKKAFDLSTKEGLKKGLYDVGRIACIISELKWIRTDILVEESLEGDGTSALPSAVQKATDALCEFLLTLVTEEVQEIMSNTDVQLEEEDTIIIIANAVNTMPEGLRKGLLDILPTEGDKVEVFTKLAGMLKTASAAADEMTQKFGKNFKGLQEADLFLDNPNLPPAVASLLAKSNGLEFRYEKLHKIVEAMTARIEKIAAQPEPPKGVLRVITKAMDAGFAGTGQLSQDDQDVVDAYRKRLEVMTPEQRARELIKMSLANPVAHFD